MKIVKGILTKLIYIILIVLVTFNVYNYICINVLKQELPTINGYGVLEVVSGSMEPTIDVGDLIIVNTKYDELKENDIITFYDEQGSFVTHRIIEIVDGEYVTKGDNNDSLDQGNITKNEIVGIYITRIKGMGRLMAAFKNPLTMIMILIIGILVCVLVSTDKEGKPIITEEEKEYEEFLEYKKSLEQDKKESEVKTKNNVKTSKDKNVEIESEIKKKDLAEKSVVKPTRTSKKKSSVEKKITTKKKSTETNVEKKTTDAKKRAPKAKDKKTTSVKKTSKEK